MPDFNIVRDSSIWYPDETFRAVNVEDNRICFGIVREAHNDTLTNELRYLVEIRNRNDVILTNCRMARRWGGAYNYEDYVLRGYSSDQNNAYSNAFSTIPGDIVIVANLGGQSREGVIIGSLTHPARKSFLDATLGPQFRSEFNGIETHINEDGEWTLTFRGQPTNLAVLDNTPADPVPAPEYDLDIGTSFMKWDKTGSFTVSDNATDSDGPQRLFIDKPNGVLEIDSGKISLVMTKKDQSVVLTDKTTEIDAEESITYKTKVFEGSATDHVHIVTPLYIVESPAVRLGEEAATDWLILGTTFREQQVTMNGTMVTQLYAAAAGLATASGKLAFASTQSSWNGVVQSNISQAATAINDTQLALQAVAAAIQAFEAAVPNNYLSQVSKTK